MLISTRSVWAMALGAALLLGAGELAAQGAPPAGGRAGGGGGGRGGAPMNPTTYRQNIMMGFQQNQAALTAIRNGTVGTQGNILNRAIILQQLAMSLSDAFPPNSIGEGSRALPAIWTNTADFQARIQSIQTDANALVEAARGGNAEAIAAAQTKFGQNCMQCHMTFRGPAPGN